MASAAVTSAAAALPTGAVVCDPPRVPAPAPPLLLVLDTHIVLDLWWFGCAHTAPMEWALASGHARWLATDRMLDELAHVVAYPHLQRYRTALAARFDPADPGAERSTPHPIHPHPTHHPPPHPTHPHRLPTELTETTDWLTAVAARRTCVATAPPTALRCQDPDDQMFIDLAVQHRARLVSRDKAVLKLRRRLLQQGVLVDTELPNLSQNL